MSFLKKIVKGAKNVLDGDSVDKGKATASSQTNNVFRFKTKLILYMAWVCGGISVVNI